jgi:lipopolysaccharide transport system permease protein
MAKQLESNEHMIDLHTSGKSGMIQQWSSFFSNIRQYRFFIRQLIRINIQTEFKRSFIGLSWLFIVPLLSVLIWILLNGAGVIDPGDTEIPYPAYVLLSTSIWGFFSEMYKSTSNLINSNGRMMIMTAFPHEVLIIEKVVVHFIRFSIPFILNIGVLIFFGVPFTWTALLFPITLFPLLFMGAAIGLLVALLRIVAMDLSNLVDEGIRLLMFLTPVVYAPKLNLGWLAGIVEYNPMTYLIGFSRDVLTKGAFFEPERYFICVLISSVFLLISLRIFRATEVRVLERLINT